VNGNGDDFVYRTLFAFFIVCISIPILRIVRPDANRKFKVPGGLVLGGFILPLLGAGSAVLLIGRHPHVITFFAKSKLMHVNMLL
jgi:amino acid transporter